MVTMVRLSMSSCYSVTMVTTVRLSMSSCYSVTMVTSVLTVSMVTMHGQQDALNTQ